MDKTSIWLQIAESLRLHTPMFIDKSERKKHSTGRREDRTVPRDVKKGTYRRTDRGYLVRAE